MEIWKQVRKSQGNLVNQRNNVVYHIFEILVAILSYTKMVEKYWAVGHCYAIFKENEEHFRFIIYRLNIHLETFNL